MITETGTIQENGKTVGQLQIVSDAEGNRTVQLYTSNGIFLASCPFDGDDDKGLEIGMGLYHGYVNGWSKAKSSFREAVSEALYQASNLDLEIK